MSRNTINYDNVGCYGEISWDSACRVGTTRGHYIKVKELIQEDAKFGSSDYKINLQTIVEAFNLVDTRCKENSRTFIQSRDEITFRTFLAQEIKRRNDDLTQRANTIPSNTP